MPRGTEVDYVTFDALHTQWLMRDLRIVKSEVRRLGPYDKEFYAAVQERVDDAHELGCSHAITRKQFQYLKSLALTLRGR